MVGKYPRLFFRAKPVTGPPETASSKSFTRCNPPDMGTVVVFIMGVVSPPLLPLKSLTFELEADFIGTDSAELDSASSDFVPPLRMTCWFFCLDAVDSRALGRGYHTGPQGPPTFGIHSASLLPVGMGYVAFRFQGPTTLKCRAGASTGRYVPSTTHQPPPTSLGAVRDWSAPTGTRRGQGLGRG